MKSSKTENRLAAPEFKSLLDQCIHCGLCLQSCPTYAVFRTEMDSPRGRIALMRAASDGRIEPGGAYQTHINLCLMCRACEQACPSGVQYGTMIEIARVALEESRRPGPIERFIRWLTLRQLMPHQKPLRFLAAGVRWYQTLGIQSVVHRLGLLPKTLRNVEALLPDRPAPRPLRERIAPAIGNFRGQVAFFHGCVQDAFLGEVNAATIRVLQRNGYDVHVPAAQTCCGAAQLHVGEDELFLEMARKNIDNFDTGQYEAIINNAGGCGSTLKEYGQLLRNDPDYAAKARDFCGKVRDINEFLHEHLHQPPRGVIHTRAVYADSCHLRHVQKVIQQPRDLLKMIPGLELLELAKPDRCCGSAGLYNIMQAEAADAILDEKMEDILSTRADVIVTTNTGCHLQLMNGVRRTGMQARVVHLVELLDQSYSAEGKTDAKC